MSSTDTEFDVIVIGAGPAGEVAAGRCADGGLRVAIIERELVGGECSYWGCIPSKTLIRPGDVLAAARRVPGAAEAVTGSIDVAAAFAQRDHMTSNWNDAGQVAWLDEKGIALFRGAARLTGPKAVFVATADGGGIALAARTAVVLATGTIAAVPPIPGLGDLEAWDNRGVTSATQLPRRLLVLGGGAVGVEMAQAFKRLGCAEVTVLEDGERLLAREEPFAGDQLREAFEAESITVLTGVSMIEVRRERDAGPIVATLADGRQITADELLVSVGRRPATRDIGLDSVGIEPGNYVAVDDQLRAVGVDGGWLYAVGDCNGRALLTHMGKYQARIAGDAILGKEVTDLADHHIVPRVTFTDPQICAVGLTEVQARTAGIDVRVVEFNASDVAGAATQGVGVTARCQLVIDESRRVIVGATFTGPGIAELLHSATIAIVGRLTMEQLWHAVPSFPTVSEVWLRLMEAYGL